MTLGQARTCTQQCHGIVRRTKQSIYIGVSVPGCPGPAHRHSTIVCLCVVRARGLSFVESLFDDCEVRVSETDPKKKKYYQGEVLDLAMCRGYSGDDTYMSCICLVANGPNKAIISEYGVRTYSYSNSCSGVQGILHGPCRLL